MFEELKKQKKEIEWYDKLGVVQLTLWDLMYKKEGGQHGFKNKRLRDDTSINRDAIK